MLFLAKSDFDAKIRSEILDIVTGSNDALLDQVERDVEIEIRSYLAGRYDVDALFPYFTNWNKANAYAANDIVLLTASAFAAGNYTAGNYAVYSGRVYRCEDTGAAVIADLANPAKWTNVAPDKTFYSAVAAVIAGVEIDETASWTAGDTRNALIVRFMLDLIVYELHCRINPKNVPESRLIRRDDAIRWLKAVADPRNNMNPDFPLRDHGTDKGNDISFGSNTKAVTHYY